MKTLPEKPDCQTGQQKNADQDSSTGPGNKKPETGIADAKNDCMSKTQQNEQNDRASQNRDNNALHARIDDVVDDEGDQPRLLGLVVQRHVRQDSFLWGTLFCIFLFTAFLYALSTPEMSRRSLDTFLVPGTGAFVMVWLGISALLLSALCHARNQRPPITLFENNPRLIERTYVCCAGGRVWLTLIAISLLLPDPDASLATRQTIVFLMTSAGVLAALADCCATCISFQSSKEKDPS